MPVCFTKPHLDILQQLKLLQGRGMAISDPQKAGQYLERIGYYRLSGYWHPFRQSQTVTGSNGRSMRQVLDAFRPGVEFGHAVDLYVFDKKLRLLFLDAIERIEVGIRVRIALLLGARNPWAYRIDSELDGNFAKKINPETKRSRHQDWLQRLDAATHRSKEDFVEHFRSKYSSPLPIWIAIELWDFGLLSIFLSGMMRKDRQKIAGYYSVPREQLLCSWTRSINYVRNICAHHSRLWNRSLVDQPKPLRNDEIPLLDHLVGNTRAQSRLYAVAAVMQFLLRTINPTTSWDVRLKQHLANFPANASGITVRQMGFPESWEHLELWK
jgi:abortive infection bacteriophage resistance protein